MMLSVTPFCKILKTYMYKSAKKKIEKIYTQILIFFLGNGVSGDFRGFCWLDCFAAYDYISSKISHLSIKTYLDQ